MINFCKYFDLLLINCEIEIDLTCSTYSIISQASKTFREIDPNADEGYEEVIATTGAKLQIDNAKLYVPVVTLSINDNINFKKYINQGFKRTFSWNKYRSELTTQPKTIIQIIWLIQLLEILIDCLFFHSRMEMMILL